MKSGSPLELDTSRPALVIGGGGRGTLGVVRSLGSAGISVHTALTDANSPVSRSRFVSVNHDFALFGATGEQKLERLLAIIRSLPERPLLFTAGDNGLKLMLQYRRELSHVADLDLAPGDVVEACLDKASFAELAARHGLPTPATCKVTSLDEAGSVAQTLEYPVFVKPNDTSLWQPLVGRVVRSAKGVRVDSLREFLELFSQLASVGPAAVTTAVIQEYVEGGDDQHFSVDLYRDPAHGITRLFSARKLYLWPPHAGFGCFVISETVPDLVRHAASIVESLGYYGAADLDFKRDMRSGEFKLFEINCRYSMWTELPFRAGVNLPVAGYASMTRQTIPSVQQRDGVAWFDLQRMRQGLRSYRGAPDWSWRRFMQSLAHIRSGAFFAADDMAPFWHQLRYRNGS